MYQTSRFSMLLRLLPNLFIILLAIISSLNKELFKILPKNLPCKFSIQCGKRENCVKKNGPNEAPLQIGSHSWINGECNVRRIQTLDVSDGDALGRCHEPDE